MRRLLTLFLVLPILIAQTAIASDIDRLLELPESKIDIGIAALTLAKEFYPDLDISAYSTKIDVLVEKARLLARGTQDPEQRIRVLNTVLFRQAGFHYDREPFSRDKQEYYFLNGILDGKKGLCYTMPLLYTVVAQRLGYPIYPVTVPDHMFVRYVDLFKAANIETTSGGKYFTDESYAENFAVGKSGRPSGNYLRTMTYKEFLGQMLAANAFIYSKNGNEHKAIVYLEKAIRLDPKHAGHYDNLRATYLAKSQNASGEAALRYREKSKRYALKAKELGYVSPEEIADERKIRGK